MPASYGTKKYFEQHHACVYVGDAGKKGRGVFAGEKIKKNWLIEEAPCLLFQMNEDDGDWSYFDHVIYHWGDHGWFAMALGFGSLYNHSNRPNAVYHLARNEHGQPSITFWALRDIEKGKEITINYNGDPQDKTPVEFDEDQ